MADDNKMPAVPANIVDIGHRKAQLYVPVREPHLSLEFLAVFPVQWRMDAPCGWGILEVSKCAKAGAYSCHFSQTRVNEDGRWVEGIGAEKSTHHETILGGLTR